jgi:hypothetical protein
MTDPRISSPAALRNRDAILAILRETLPPQGLLLEIASGTGEHAAHFGANLPKWHIQPTDIEEPRRASINAWCESLPNVQPALHLDTTTTPWPIREADAILCCNMIHIAPWPACLGLLAGAADALAPGQPLILYGPYLRDHIETAPSNTAFDADLKSRNPTWGLRRLEDVTAAATGFSAPRVIEMPANNLCVVLLRKCRS